ncbi:MAG: hypothetical protein IJ532_00430 [Alphaproteobacteria bacterium]|nr:hypothetical protein [Alphaproteobacteria bacterium]
MGKICTFFGHRFVPDEKKVAQYALKVIRDLIINDNVTEFWCGGYGNFDALTGSIVKKLQKEYPHIKISRVLAYMPKHKEDIEYLEKIYDNVFLPDGVELGLPRYGIIERNRYMAQTADVCVCYVKWDGGARKAMNIALKYNKKVINLADLLNIEIDKF